MLACARHSLCRRLLRCDVRRPPSAPAPQYRRRREELEEQADEVEVEAEQAQRLMRAVVQVRVCGGTGMGQGLGVGAGLPQAPLGARCRLQPRLCAPHPFTPPQSNLGRARGSMLQWLLKCLSPLAQASTTRAKAVKALGEVVQADPRVLDAPSVQQAVDRALQVRLPLGLPTARLDACGRRAGRRLLHPLLACPPNLRPNLIIPISSQDEAISVREAAVTLLGRHAAANQALALRLFNTLAKVGAGLASGCGAAAACLRLPCSCPCMRSQQRALRRPTAHAAAGLH